MTTATNNNTLSRAGVDFDFAAQYGLTILPAGPIHGSSNAVRFFVKSKDDKEIAEVKPHQIDDLLATGYFAQSGMLLPGKTNILWTYKARTPSAPRTPKHDDQIGSLKIVFSQFYDVEIHAKVNGKTRRFTHPQIKGSSLIRHMRAEVDKGAFKFCIKTDWTRTFSAKQVIDAAALDKSTPKARREVTLSPGKHDLHFVIKQEYDDGDHTPINLWMGITIDGESINPDKPFLELNQLLGDKWRDLFWMRFSGHLNFAQADYTVKRDRPGRFYATQPKDERREITALDLQGFFSMFENVGRVTIAQHVKPGADADAITAEKTIADNTPTPVKPEATAKDAAAALALVKEQFPNLSPREQIALAKELIA